MIIGLNYRIELERMTVDGQDGVQISVTHWGDSESSPEDLAAADPLFVKGASNIHESLLSVIRSLVEGAGRMEGFEPVDDGEEEPQMPLLEMVH